MGRWDSEIETEKEEKWYKDILILVIIGSFSMIGVVFTLVTLDHFIMVSTYQTTVTSIYLYAGSTACGYTLNGNHDFAYPCEYKVGDTVTILKSLLGTYHVKGVNGY